MPFECLVYDNNVGVNHAVTQYAYSVDSSRGNSKPASLEALGRLARPTSAVPELCRS